MPLTAEQIKNIETMKRRRKREAAFMAFLDFLSVVATLACVFTDAFSLLGIPLILSSAFTLGMGLMVGALVLAFVAGIFWAIKRYKGYTEARQKELGLMHDCNELANENSKLGATLNEPEEAPKLSWKASLIQFLSKAGNRAMSFLNGLGTMLGVAGTIFGAASLTLAIGMPLLLLGIFIAVGVFSITFGILSVVMDYYLSRSQENHIDALINQKEALRQAGFDKKLSDKEERIAELEENNKGKRLRSNSLPAKLSECSLFKTKKIAERVPLPRGEQNELSISKCPT